MTHLVPFCPDCGAAGTHTAQCGSFPGDPVTTGNFLPVIVADPDRVVAWFAGSRDWSDWHPVEDDLARLPKHAVVVHGGQRGLDSIAGAAARARGLHVAPVLWRPDLYGKGAGPLRNQAIRQFLPTVGYAYPLGRSPGTHNMISLMRAAGAPVHVWRPT